MNGDRGRWTKSDRKGQRDIEREKKKDTERRRDRRRGMENHYKYPFKEKQYYTMK